MKREVAESILSAGPKIEASMKDGFKDFDLHAKPLYKAMVDDIKKQKKRLGGDFAIAHAVATRASRDFIRQELGSEVVFIVLSLTLECQKKRILGRHGDAVENVQDMMGDMYKLYEDAGDDEPNSYNVVIEDTHTPAMVLETVLDLIKKI